MKKMPKGVFNLFDLFDRESDRAAVVLAGAYLDATLDEMLRTWLEPGAHVHLDPPNGFASTYGAKYNLAHAIGAIPPPAREWLKVVGAIRNHFAHHVMDADWRHPNVQKHLRKLPVRTGTGTTDREHFLTSVTMLSLLVRESRLRAPQRKRLAKDRWKAQSDVVDRVSQYLARLRERNRTAASSTKRPRTARRTRR